MSPEDAARYNRWVELREAGLDQQVVNDILLTNKGYRPDPTKYLSKEYIDAHLEMFSDGVTKISKATPSGQAGPPGGTTGGGIPEVTIDSPLPAEYISTPIFE